MKRRIPVIVAVVLLLAGGAVWWWWSTQQTATPANRLTGSVEATQYTVAPAIAGRVAEVLVAEGAVVKAGDPVVRLDPTALQLAVDQAKAGVDAAKAVVQQKQDDGTVAEVAEAQARQAVAEAGVRLAEVQLGFATVTAPHDGTVVTLTTNAGQNAAPGRTMLTLIDTADLRVRTFVPEPQLAQVALGTTVTISGDGVAERQGTVTWVAAQPEFTPSNVETRDQRTKLVYQVRIDVADDTGTLRPGQPVDVTLP